VPSGCIQFFDELHECLSRETLTAVEGVKIWCRDSDQRRQIIGTSCDKHLLDGPSSRSRTPWGDIPKALATAERLREHA
jgi:hypothetical protein